MRRFGTLALLLFLLVGAHALCASPTQSVSITAQKIALYSDRAILIMEGGVAVHAPQFAITATRAAYDLRGNRLVAAGDVTVSVRGVKTLSAAGYVYDFTAKRGLPSPNASVPQLSTQEALVVGQQVELQPAVSMTFSNAQVLTGSAFVPSASYTYAIPPPAAKDFGYSPVPSAALEWAVLLGSSADGYQFARFRYDRYNGGPGAGLEEHYARTDRGYVALGETVDVDGAREDLAAYERLTPSLSQSLTASNLIATRTMRYALTSVGRRGFASLSFSQYNGSRTDDLFVAGNQRPIGRIASFHLQADLGHDVHPGYPQGDAQDFRLTPGIHVDRLIAAHRQRRLEFIVRSGRVCLQLRARKFGVERFALGELPVQSETAAQCGRKLLARRPAVRQHGANVHARRDLASGGRVQFGKLVQLRARLRASVRARAA